MHEFNDPEPIRMLILVNRRCKFYVGITQSVIFDKSTSISLRNTRIFVQI